MVLKWDEDVVVTQGYSHDIEEEKMKSLGYELVGYLFFAFIILCILVILGVI